MPVNLIAVQRAAKGLLLVTLSWETRRCAMLAVRTILHPTDFSERSDCAFELACALARDYGARLILLHVVEPPLAVSGDGLVMVPVPIHEEPIRERLKELRPQDHTIQVEYRLTVGDAAGEILGEAQEAKPDLIVMGTHGRSGLSRLLMGSVAEQVVRKADCPVLTVKTPLPQVRFAGEGAPTPALVGK
jgi:nucleotide-binding universal stress UspA family protein